MIKRAICFGCSSQAGVLATVEDGKIVRLKGEPDHYMNRGWLCERARGFNEHVYHPERLNYPLKRVGERGEGRWERISWNHALDEIAEKLAAIKERYGAEALASHGGTGRGHQETFKRRFMNLFGSPNNANVGQWCAIVSYIVESAILGFLTRSKGGANPSRCIVIWGHNPEESQPCLNGPAFEYTDRLSSEQRSKQLGADRPKFWTWPGYELIQKASMPY